MLFRSLRATSRESTAAATGSAWIFRGMAVGAAVKLLISLAYLFPGELHTAVPVLPKAELALEVAPALLGVGSVYQIFDPLTGRTLLADLILDVSLMAIGATLVFVMTSASTRSARWDPMAGMMNVLKARPPMMAPTVLAA